jgi:hypothetical protein
VSEGGVKRPLREILVVVETQTTPSMESWRRWVENVPLWRESILSWWLSCPPLLKSREQERERNPKQEEDEEKECEMVSSGEQMRYL